MGNATARHARRDTLIFFIILLSKDREMQIIDADIFGRRKCRNKKIKIPQTSRSVNNS